MSPDGDVGISSGRECWFISSIHQSAHGPRQASDSLRAEAPSGVWVQQTMDRPEPEKEMETHVTMPGSFQLGVLK